MFWYVFLSHKCIGVRKREAPGTEPLPIEMKIIFWNLNYCHKNFCIATVVSLWDSLVERWIKKSVNLLDTLSVLNSYIQNFYNQTSTIGMPQATEL